MIKKIISVSVVFFLIIGCVITASAYSISDITPGFFTEEYIYIQDGIFYELLDEALDVELGGMYICNDKGDELQPKDPITTGCKLMKKDGAEDILLYTYIVLGDVNHDGTVTASDARSVLRAASKLDSITEYIDYTAADVNISYSIDASDARIILRYAANIIQYDIFSQEKLSETNYLDQKYVIVYTKDSSITLSSDMFDGLTERVIPMVSDPTVLILELKNPGRDNADKLLFMLNTIDGIYVNNPFDISYGYVS